MNRDNDSRDDGEPNDYSRPDNARWERASKTVSAHDDGAPNYRSGPALVPDHGAQPRYKRQHRRHDPFDQGPHRETPAERKASKIADLLSGAARHHAPKLAWRTTDEEISDLIRTEVLPDARFVAASLPPELMKKVLDRFVEVLWEEIRFQRQFRRKMKKS
jgi:hypothetical protein